jgi:hypothetical protein
MQRPAGDISFSIKDAAAVDSGMKHNIKIIKVGIKFN